MFLMKIGKHCVNNNFKRVSASVKNDSFFIGFFVDNELAWLIQIILFWKCLSVKKVVLPNQNMLKS